MTLLDALRPVSARTQDASPASSDEATEPLLTNRHRALAATILVLLLAGVLALVFGPARGLRTDIVNVSDDLDASRDGIFLQLDTVRGQLAVAEDSLQIQEQGLAVAVEAEQDATTAAQSTQEILQQTREALALVREVTQSLGPLDQLDDKVDAVVRDLEQTVRIAQQTLAVAEQTLATGREALAVARDPLGPLQRGERIQAELLRTAQATLEQTREINRKIPGAPVFPEQAPAP